MNIYSRLDAYVAASVLILCIFIAGFSISAHADEMHGNAIFHSFQLEMGVGSTDDGHGFAEWDLDGWIGIDERKLWFKAEGERENGHTEQAELWAMYGHSISDFWDVQVGMRHDTQPNSLWNGVVGFKGLAPYGLETEAHLFISEDGDISARLRQEGELLLTQRWIIEPYWEADIFVQDVRELDVGAGISAAEIGLQLRYEFTRDFAPFLDVKYERHFGETASIARNDGEGTAAVIGTLGMKFLF